MSQFDGRIAIRYYCDDWPGAKDIIYPDQFEKYGWSWASFFERKYGDHVLPQLHLTIEPDLDNPFDMFIHFQYSKSMRDTILSLPSRTHVPQTGTNTYRVPVFDLDEILSILEVHENYVIIVNEAVEERAKIVAREVADIKSIADIPDDDKEKLAEIRRVIAESPSISNKYRFYTFQEAGIAAMLYIFGVYDKLVPGKCVLSLSEAVPAASTSLPLPPPSFGYDKNGKKSKKKKRQTAKEMDLVLFGSTQGTKNRNEEEKSSLEDILNLNKEVS